MGQSQDLVIERMEEPGIKIERFTGWSREAFGVSIFFWFGMAGETLFFGLWTKGRSAGCFSISLSWQISTTTSDFQVFTGK